MASTPNNNNNNVIDVDLLEEVLAAALQPRPSNSSAVPSASAPSFSLADDPSRDVNNHNHASGPPRVTTDQPGAVPDVAAAGTAHHDSDGTSSLHRPSLQVQQASSTQRLAMDEFIQSRSNDTWENLVNSFRPQGFPSGLPTGTEMTAAAFSAATNGPPRLELIEDYDASGMPLPIGMIEEGLAFEEGRAASAGNNTFDHSVAAASGAGGPTPPSGLEVIDDNDGPPRPVGMGELGDQSEGKMRGGVDIIDDDAGPDPPNATFAEQMNDKTFLVNGLSPPTPFNPSTLEEDADEKKQASMQSDGESIIVPTREEIEDDDQFGNNIVSASRWDIGGDEPTPAVDNQMDIDGTRSTVENTLDTGGANDAVDGADLEPETTVESELGGEDRSTLVIPEAFPVEERSDDGIIIQGHAKPLLPWWKQRRTKLLIGASISIIVILVIVLGVSFSSNRTDVVPALTYAILRTNAPSQSNVPSDAPSTTNPPSDRPSDSPSASLVPTAAPSIEPSFFPSYSPSECVNQITSNAKKIDLPVDDPFLPLVSLDGKDMVVVVNQGGSDTEFIIFYTLTNGEWKKINTFQEDGLGAHSSVALSGTTAFIGFEKANDYAGSVLIYEKDQSGDWKLMENPLIHDAHEEFGLHVDISGNLACVTSNDGTHIYHQNSKWVHFDKIDHEHDHWAVGCSIAGDTIAIGGWLYRYNQELNGVELIQDPIGVLDSFELSHDYLVYWSSNEKDAFVYRREKATQKYMFLQQLNISGPRYNKGLALDNDILVVGGNDEIHIFSQQNDGKWEKTITMDQSNYRYALSGRSLIATTRRDEVYYFDIEGCSQAMPTQTPSLSIAPSSLTLAPSSSSSPSMNPSSSPTTTPSSSSLPSMIPSLSPTTTPSSSSYPTMSPSLTLAPSSSSSPTDTCFWVHVSIRSPYQTSWELHRLEPYELVVNHHGSLGDTSHRVESLCLQEAEYILSLYGPCCGSGKAYYDITSNDMSIVEGEFEFYEKAAFSLPFISHSPSISPSSTLAPLSSSPPSSSPSSSPTTAPSSSYSPSMSPSLTLAPSSSSSPTETCDWIQIAITFDDWADETSWQLQRVVGDGGELELVKQASEGDNSYVESLCLQEGEYIFTIYDSCGDGIFSEDYGEGHYNVTSNGIVIVEGGEFLYSESTPFSIPLVPPSISPTSAPSSSSSPSMIPSSTLAPSSSSSPSMIPSTTRAPSDLPSSSPSFSQSPTTAPSSSSSPSMMPSLPPTTSPSSSSPPSMSSSPTLDTSHCNLTPKERREQTRELMSTVSDPALFNDPLTPQSLALDWITNKDDIQPIMCPNLENEAGCSHGGQVNSMVQRYIMAVFYFATKGDEWDQCSAPGNFDDQDSINIANGKCKREVTPFYVPNQRRGDTKTNAWLTPVNECDWGGVACWGDFCVDQIDFLNDGLSGELAPELGHLDSMRFLILEEGTISGPIPSEYGKLQQLLILGMDFNQITGSLPDEIYNLPQLQQLDLNDNQLTGSISSRIGDLSMLTFFQIDHNLLSNTIPSEMGELSNLRMAFLNNNGIVGSMPEEVCALRNNNSPQGLLGVLVTDCVINCECCSSCF